MVKHWKGSANFATVGLDVVLCMLVGLFGGRWLDGKFGTAPWLTTLGFFVGVGAGAKAVFRGYKAMQRITALEEREQGNPTPRYGLDEADEAQPPREDAQPSGRDADSPTSSNADMKKP